LAKGKIMTGTTNMLTAKYPVLKLKPPPPKGGLTTAVYGDINRSLYHTTTTEELLALRAYNLLEYRVNYNKKKPGYFDIAATERELDAAVKKIADKGLSLESLANRQYKLFEKEYKKYEGLTPSQQVDLGKKRVAETAPERGQDFKKDTEYFDKLREEIRITEKSKDVQGNLKSQILKQGTTGKWSGEGFGSADANASVMASKLASIGIERLEDFGRVPILEPINEARYYNGRQVFNSANPPPRVNPAYIINNDKPPAGDYTMETRYDEMNGVTYYVFNEVPKNAKVESVYTATVDLGGANEDGSGGTVYGQRPLDSNELNYVVNKDGKAYLKLGETYGNKKTGAIMPSEYDRSGGAIWSGTFAGKGSTGFGVSFNELGMPVFYTQYGGSTSDWGAISSILGVASMIPGPHQPFTMALNAIGQAANGNTLGAVLSALGAAKAYGQAYNTLPTEIGTQSFDIDTLDDYVAAGVENTAANWLATNAGTIQTVTQGVQLLNALDKGNLQGIISSLAGLSPQIGVSIPEDLMRPVQYAAVASAISKGDFTGASLAAATLTGNSNVKVAVNGANFVRALKSGNPASMLSASIGFAKEAQLGGLFLSDASKQIGIPLSEKNASDLLSIPEGQADEQVKEYYKEVQEVKADYKKNFGEDLTDEKLLDFAESGGIKNGYEKFVSDVRYDEATFDSSELAEAYKAVYGKEPTKEWLASEEAFDMLGRSDAQGENLVYNYYIKDKNETTEAEAIELLKSAGLKESDITPAQIKSVVGAPEKAVTDFFQYLAVERQLYFDGSEYKSQIEAQNEAIEMGYEAYTWGGQSFKIMTPEQEGEIKDEIKNSSSFNKAFGDAMKRLGPGKTFEWTNPKTGETKTYKTEYATTNKNVPFDGSKAATNEDAAALAVANNKLSFVGPDGKVYAVDFKQAKTILETQNQSQAETNRLLRQAIKPATDESMAETQRLMSAGKPGVTDQVSTVLANTFATTAQGLGKLVQSYADAYSLATGEGLGNSVYKAGQMLEAYGKEKQVYGADVQTERMAQVQKLAAEADSELDRWKILAQGAAKYPIGFWGDVGKEFGQEAPTVLTGLAAGAALIAGAPAFAVAGAVKAATTFFETVEVFGAEGAAVERSLLAKNVPADQAREAGLMQGTFAAAITIPTEYLANKALVDVWFKGVKDATIGTVIARGGSAVSAQVAAEMMQTLPTALSSQYLINGKTDINAALAGTYYSAMVSAGTTGTLVAPTSIRDAVVVAKDTAGNNMTWKEFTSGTKVADLKTLDLSAQIGQSKDGDAITLGTLTAAPVGGLPSYEFLKDVLPSSVTNQNYIVGTDALGDPVTLDMLTNQVTSKTSYDTVFNNLLTTTPQQRNEAQYDFLKTVLDDSNYTFTESEVRALIKDNPAGREAIKAQVDTYTKPRQVTRAEAEQFFKEIGYKPTKEEVDQFIRQGSSINQDTVKNELAAYVDPRFVDEQEARQELINLGYTDPTPDEINAFIGQKDETSTLKAIQEQYNPLATTLEEAKQMMRDLGYTNFTDAEAMSFAGKIKEADARTNVGAYVDPRQITQDEAKKFFAEFNYVPTPEELASYVRQGSGINQENVRAELEQYIDPRLVTEQEAKDAYAALGLNKPTQADILKLIGQYDETGLTGKATENLDAAKYNSLLQQIEQLGAQSNIDPAALEAIKNDLNAQITALGGDVTKLQAGLDSVVAAQATAATQLADLKNSLSAEIQAAKDTGLEGDAAIQAGLDSLAQKVGTNQADLLKQLGTTAADLKTQFATDLAQTERDILAEVAKNEKAGMSRDAALQKAINTVAAAQKKDVAALTKSISGLGTDLGKEIAAVQANLEAQMRTQYDSLTAAQKAAADALVAQGKTLQDAIAAAKAETAGQIADVETRLTEAIAAAEAMGLTRDQAITAAVESVAAELGTTKASLLTQLGTTEAALRTEFGAGLAGVSAEVKAAYDALSVEQKALADQLTKQGTDLATAIQTAQQQTQSQIGALSADMQAKYNALTAEQKALANDMAQQGMDLTAAINLAQQQTQAQITGLGEQVDARINELMQQGQTYQQATQQAIGELNTKNQQLQNLVGTQGRAATQADIDAMSQMLGGQRAVDLSYDVTGDKQVTQADIDFLTQVVSGVKTDWTAPVGSFLGPTGLYGQLATNEAQRQADLASSQRQRDADLLEAQRQREREDAAAKEEARRANIRSNLSQGRQQLQGIQQQLPQALQAAQEVSTPIYGQMGPYLDIGSELDFGFFKPSPEKQAATKQQQTTKIAAGGYIDDLLAEDMTADDLLNLLR